MMICEEHKKAEGQRTYPGQRCPWCIIDSLMVDLANRSSSAPTFQQKYESALLQIDLLTKDLNARLSMTVARLGGTVEGRPTEKHNYLQRIDELRETERLNGEMNAALQLAYDWMGRKPETAYTEAHLRSAREKVENVLKAPLRPKDVWRCPICRSLLASPDANRCVEGHEIIKREGLLWKCAHCGSRRMGTVLHEGFAHCLDCCNNTKVE